MEEMEFTNYKDIHHREQDGSIASKDILVFYEIIAKKLTTSITFGGNKKNATPNTITPIDVLEFISNSSPIKYFITSKTKNQYIPDINNFIGVSLGEISKEFNINREQRSYIIGMLTGADLINKTNVRTSELYTATNNGLSIISYIRDKNKSGE